MTVPVQVMIDKALEAHPDAEVVKRDRSQIRHRIYLPDGRESYISGISQGALHYKDAFGTWREINTALSPSAARVGADLGNVTAGFESHFNLNLGAAWTAEYRKGTSAIRLKPVRLQSGTKSWLAQPIVGVVKDDVIRWTNAFGPGIHLEWQAQGSRLAKKVILDSPLTLTADLDLVLEVQLENLPLPTITDTHLIPLGSIGFIRWPTSSDATGETAKGKLLMTVSGEKRYLTHRIPRAWLASATYPVVIDIELDEYVGATGDDVDCQYRVSTAAWSFSSTGFQLRLGSYTADYNRRGFAARFSSVDVSRYADISKAYFYVYSYTDYTVDTCHAYLYGHAHDNSPQVTNATDLRALATQKTPGILDTVIDYDWVCPNWFGYEVDSALRSPYTVVSDIVNRPGWVSGNALTMVWEDWDGRSDVGATRAGFSYDGDALHPPYLHIHWTEAVTQPQGMMF